MRPVAEISYSEIVMERVRVAARAAVTNYALRNAEVRTWSDHLIDGLVFELRSHVLGHERWEIDEAPHYEGWVDQLMDTLPEHSFRRRFLAFYFGHDVRAKRVRHTVTVRAYDTFPEATVEFPRELGHPVVMAMLDSSLDRLEGEGRR